MVRVGLKRHQPCACQLINLFLHNLVRLRRVELELLNLFGIAGCLSEVNLFIVATNEVASDHGLRLTDHFEDLFVQGGLHDTVIELDYEHILLDTTQALSNELHALHLIVIKPSAHIMITHFVSNLACFSFG